VYIQTVAQHSPAPILGVVRVLLVMGRKESAI
jgi:hypothetical protein